MKRSRRPFVALPLLALVAMNLHCEAADSGAAGSGGAGGPDGGVAPPVSQTLEVNFGAVTFEIVEDRGGCAQAFTNFSILGQEFVLATLQTYLSGAIAEGQILATVRSNARRVVRLEPGESLCASMSMRALETPVDSAEVCLEIEAETDALAFSARLDNGACVIDVTAPIVARRFDLPAFCEFACMGNVDCGRVLDNCVEGCIADLTNASIEEDPICHDATRFTIRCLYRAPCAGLPPERVCDQELRDRAFDEPSCPTPPIPMPPEANPDPLRCDPTQADLVSGTLGDFAIISRTRDDPSAYYLILDLLQLTEVDAAIAEDPTSPSLELAAAVARDLRAADQTSIDSCEQTRTVSLRFEPPFVPNFGSIDATLVQLQGQLDELANLAGEVKRQATAFIFEEIFCPATSDLVGDDLPGLAIQAVIGCL
ncbi:MAG: hypothetical protein HKP50_04150 [Myxococcales bacterium]|nr:hypothetical protein [Myxococcales bacterium]